MAENQRAIPCDSRQAVEYVASGLRAWRADVRHISQEELAAEMGVSRCTIQAMESGSPGVAIGTWFVAWRAMGVLGGVRDNACLSSHRTGELRMRAIIERGKAREQERLKAHHPSASAA